MNKKALRVTVQGGRIQAVYDDRLAGLIARLGGARSGDGMVGTGGRCGGGPSNRRDDSQPIQPRTIHTGLLAGGRGAAGPSCKTDSSGDVEPLETVGCVPNDRLASMPRDNHDTSVVRDGPNEDGTGSRFHVEPLSRQASPLIITRASLVEPGPEGGWTADMALSGGGVLGPYPSRADALEAEQAWLRRELGL